jgi:hypothetical protein
MAALIDFRITGDPNYEPQSDIIYPSQYINAYVLAAGVAETVTKPTGARIAIFNSTGNFYVNWLGATAAVPSVDIITGLAPELNPVARDVSGQTTFSIIAPDACIVTIAYFT